MFVLFYQLFCKFHIILACFLFFAYSILENENVYGQNRYRWLSDDYKNQSRVSDYEYGNDSYTTSTPKGKPSFSFKVPESEVKKGSSNFFQVDEQDQLLTEYAFILFCFSISILLLMVFRIIHCYSNNLTNVCYNFFCYLKETFFKQNS